MGLFQYDIVPMLYSYSFSDFGPALREWYKLYVQNSSQSKKNKKKTQFEFTAITK